MYINAFKILSNNLNNIKKTDSEQDNKIILLTVLYINYFHIILNDVIDKNNLFSIINSNNDIILSYVENILSFIN